MKEVMMKCGHTANAQTGSGEPFCAICMCGDVDGTKPSLEGRTSKCTECGAKEPSKWNLPFFRYRPNEDYDEHYCGCKGWD